MAAHGGWSAILLSECLVILTARFWKRLTKLLKPMLRRLPLHPRRRYSLYLRNGLATYKRRLRLNALAIGLVPAGLLFGLGTQASVEHFVWLSRLFCRGRCRRRLTSKN